MNGEALSRNRVFAVALLSAVVGGAAGMLYASRGQTRVVEAPPKTAAALAARDIALRSFASSFSSPPKTRRGGRSPREAASWLAQGVVATSFHVLRLPYFNPVRYLTSESDAEWRLSGTHRFFLLKRAESSMAAFRLTLDGMRRRTQDLRDELSRVEDSENAVAKWQTSLRPRARAWRCRSR